MQRNPRDNSEFLLHHKCNNHLLLQVTGRLCHGNVCVCLFSICGGICFILFSLSVCQRLAPAHSNVIFIWIHRSKHIACMRLTWSYSRWHFVYMLFFSVFFFCRCREHVHIWNTLAKSQSHHNPHLFLIPSSTRSGLCQVQWHWSRVKITVTGHSLFWKNLHLTRHFEMSLIQVVVLQPLALHCNVVFHAVINFRPRYKTVQPRPHSYNVGDPPFKCTIIIFSVEILMKEKLVIFMIYMVFWGGGLAKLLQHLIRWHSVLIMLAATIHFVL